MQINGSGCFRHDYFFNLFSHLFFLEAPTVILRPRLVRALWQCWPRAGSLLVAHAVSADLFLSV
jgi:hypothetical protein